MTSSRRFLRGPAFGLALLAAACGAAPSTAAPSAASSPATASATASATATETASATAAASPGVDDGATLACTVPATPTTAQTEGPYYRAGAPESANLVTDDMAGTRLTLTGWVVSTDCAPIADATVEIWQADSSGIYDNTGYTLRGYVTTDADGRFTIRTIVPGEYPGRTEHIHVKVTPPGGSTLTTQLYFPGATENEGDGIYSPDLLLDVTGSGDALTGTFTFVVAA